MLYTILSDEVLERQYSLVTLPGSTLSIAHLTHPSPGFIPLRQEESETVGFDLEAWHASPHCLKIHASPPLGLDEVGQVAGDGPQQVVVLWGQQ